MSFYAALRAEAEPIFQAIFAHPMVVDVTSGNVSRERWAYYLRQDYQYLRDFKQALGLVLIDLETPRQIFEWVSLLSGLADMEAKRHLAWAAQVGLAEADLLATEPDPSALVYRQHVLLAAHRGAADLLAAFAPCPMTYSEIADRAADRVPDHPVFGEWVRSYSPKLNPEMGSRFAWYPKMLDIFAGQVGEPQRARMRTSFLRSCRFEWMFWDMAYRMAGWPV